MLPIMYGLTFCGIERLSDGRLCTQVRGHAFTVESPLGMNQFLPAGARVSSGALVWSHPDAALLHRRSQDLPQPRRLRLVWMRLDVRTGLALTPEQEAAWGLGAEHRGPPAAAIHVLRHGTDVGALVLRADRLGVHGLIVGERRGSPSSGKLVEQYEVDGGSAEFDYSSLMHGLLLDAQQMRPPSMEVIDEYEVVGDSAEFDSGRLRSYPELLRQRRVLGRWPRAVDGALQNRHARDSDATGREKKSARQRLLREPCPTDRHLLNVRPVGSHGS